MAVEYRIENLARWLALGLLAGAAVVGIAIAAYAIGYHRGQHHGHPAAVAQKATTSVETATQSRATTTTSAAPAVIVTPALVARGKQLYNSDGCAACHSLSGAATVGPSFKGLAGSTITLDNGQTATADDDYLERSITSPDAQIVKGYHAGIMGPATSSFHLAGKAGDVHALVAFIKTQK